MTRAPHRVVRRPRGRDQETEQATPLTVKAVGAVFVPEWDPLNPTSVLAPGASVAFHPSPVAVTTLPVWDHVALQPWVTC